METVSDYINGTAWEDLTGEQILEFLEEHHISVSKLEAILGLLWEHVVLIMSLLVILSIAFNLFIFLRYRKKYSVNLVLQGIIMSLAFSVLFSTFQSPPYYVPIAGMAALYIAILVHNTKKCGFIRAFLSLIFAPCVVFWGSMAIGVPLILLFCIYTGILFI